MFKALSLFYRKNGQLRFWLYIPFLNTIISFLIWFSFGITYFFIKSITELIFSNG